MLLLTFLLPSPSLAFRATTTTLTLLDNQLTGMDNRHDYVGAALVAGCCSNKMLIVWEQEIS